MAAPTLQSWTHHRVRKVSLASGAGEVEIEPVDNTNLIYGDPEAGVEPQVPNDLAAIAEKVEFEGLEPEDVKKLEPAERIQLSKYRTWLISNRLRKPKMTVKHVRELPYEDQVQLFRIATHSDLAQRVMLASFREVESGPAGNGNGKAAAGSSE